MNPSLGFYAQFNGYARPSGSGGFTSGARVK